MKKLIYITLLSCLASTVVKHTASAQDADLLFHMLLLNKPMKHNASLAVIRETIFSVNAVEESIKADTILSIDDSEIPLYINSKRITTVDTNRLYISKEFDRQGELVLYEAFKLDSGGRKVHITKANGHPDSSGVKVDARTIFRDEAGRLTSIVIDNTGIREARISYHPNGLIDSLTASTGRTTLAWTSTKISDTLRYTLKFSDPVVERMLKVIGKELPQRTIITVFDPQMEAYKYTELTEDPPGSGSFRTTHITWVDEEAKLIAYKSMGADGSTEAYIVFDHNKKGDVRWLANALTQDTCFNVFNDESQLTYSCTQESVSRYTFNDRGEIITEAMFSRPDGTLEEYKIRKITYRD